jgi:hypothetical protein
MEQQQFEWRENGNGDVSEKKYISRKIRGICRNVPKGTDAPARSEREVTGNSGNRYVAVSPVGNFANTENIQNLHSRN